MTNKDSSDLIISSLAAVENSAARATAVTHDVSTLARA